MDLNITTPHINSGHENNQLFNAIKNKFGAKTTPETAAAAASPPKFNIPLLKIPGSAALENIQTVQPNKSPTQLNKFLIKKLQEKHSNNDLCEKATELVLPNLASTSQNKIAVKYELPGILQSQTEHSNICRLTTAINKLKVQENHEVNTNSIADLPAAIDLTTALATKFDTHQPACTRDLMKSQQNNQQLDFKIPFIDCDRQDVSKKHKLFLPASNEYCVKDVSHLVLQHSLAEPSAIGRFLSADRKKYTDPLPLKYFTSQFRQVQTKHSIEPFNFNTQSPDDIVLLALSKYQRRHHT